MTTFIATLEEAETQAAQAIYAAINVKKWGFYMAKLYCKKRNIPIALLMLAIVLDKTTTL